MDNCILITQTFLRLYIRKMFIQSAATSDTGGSEEDFSFWSCPCRWLNKLLSHVFTRLKIPHHISIIDVVYIRKSSSVLGFVQFHDYPWRISADQRARGLWIRDLVSSRFPFCLASIFEIKQIGKKFEIVVHPCHMNGNKDPRSEWHQ